MPHMSGLEVIDRLKEIDRQFYPPVIVMTGADDLETRFAALDHGARDFLTKPARKEEMLSRVRNMLEVRHLNRQNQTERERYQQLLQNILPTYIVERLNEGETDIVDDFHDVSVLFADLGRRARVVASGDRSVFLRPGDYANVPAPRRRTTMITRRNPATIAKPIGRYHHGVQVPPNARLLYISGQLGMNPDGTAATTPAEQIERVFQNILAILKDNDMGPEDLVKTVTFLTRREDVAVFREIRGRMFPNTAIDPAATLVFISGLADPKWFVEVEAVAAKV